VEAAIAESSRCPQCGREILPGEKSCPNCEPQRARRRRDDDDEDWDRPIPPRHREQALDAADLFVPTNVSPWAIASCYFGLIGFCIPIAGLVFSIPAFICGIIAIRKRKTAQTYGAVTSNIRAIIGLVLSTLSILISGGLLLVIALGRR
jgi:hypothetical protein